MTYTEAVARLLALRGGEYGGMTLGRERVLDLLAAIGDPHRRYALVQVGGTNGKGSVASMLAAMLRAAGRRVGLYTSPHLVSFRERIRVDAEAIPEEAVVDGVDALGTLIARFDATVFEATTVLALDHFAREGVDVAVLEVGLGGRLDATTVGVPAATVLAPIALDHEAWLGRTLAAIAAEKAAIIRAGVAIAAAQPPEAERVVLRRAAEVGVPLLLEGRDLSVTVEARSPAGQRITCGGPGWRRAGLDLPLLGTFQPTNALLAVATAHALGVPEGAAREGLRRARWPGRFQVLAGEPTIVLDGAHNPAGATALAASLAEFFAGQALTLVLGVSADKDVAGILRPLVPLGRRVVLARASNPRAAVPESLRVHAEGAGREVLQATSAAEALRLAVGPPRTPIVCVAGSLYLVGDVLRHLGGGADKPCPVEKGADSMESLSL